MPKFDLSQYETVEERIRRFYELHPDGRIVTKLIETYESHEKPKTWVFKAFVYLTAGDQAAKLPKATGYASEREGGPQTEWKAELGETSSIGRALANMNLSGHKRASRQEVEKVVRVEQADYLAQADTLTDVDALRQLYARAKAASVHPEVLERIKERASAVSSPSSLGGGAEGSVSSVPVQADGGKAPAKLLGSPKAGVRK